MPANPGLPGVALSIRLPESGPGADGILTVGQTVTLTVLVQNSGETALASLPLSFGYATDQLHLLAAAPAPTTLTAGQIGWADLLGEAILLPTDSIGVQLAFVVVASSTQLPGHLVENWAEVSGAQDIYGQLAAKAANRLPLRLTAPRIEVGKQIGAGVTSIGLGSPVTYTIRLTNAGDTTLAQIGLRDIFEPEHLRFVSASISPPVIQNRGNRSVLYWEDVTSDLGDIAPGATVSFTTLFVVAGAGSQTVNQVEVSGIVDEFADTVTNVSGEMSLTVKVAALDLELSSTPLPGSAVVGGDRITYTLRISNTGGLDLSNLWLRTEAPTNTDYLAGSAQPPTEEGRGPNGGLLWRLPALAQNAPFVAQFAAQVKPDENGGIVVSRAEAGSDQTPVARRAVVIHTALPTAVELLRFSATPGEGGLLVEWMTGAEIGSWGFHLRRGETADFTQSQLVTANLIPAMGATSGASYRFVDASAAVDGVYWYWLEEVESDGDRLFYGPVRSTLPPLLEGGYHLYLPTVKR